MQAVPDAYTGFTTQNPTLLLPQQGGEPPVRLCEDFDLVWHNKQRAGCDVEEKAGADHRCRITHGNMDRAGTAARLDLQRVFPARDAATGTACATGTPDADAAGKFVGVAGTGSGAAVMTPKQQVVPPPPGALHR